MPFVTSNCNGKIWVFTNHDFDIIVVSNTDQQLTLNLKHQTQQHNFYVTIVYAKCSAVERVSLWEDIYHLTDDMNSSWLIGGDFNVVLNAEKKIGGLPVEDIDHEDFDCCIETCELYKVQYKGSPFTWWNGRAAFKENIKRVKTVLTRWSKDTYGDIFKQLIIREDIMRIKEKLFADVPNEINRAVLQKAEAEFKRYIHFEEIYWQQKAGYEWFDNGDRNTRFFHSIVKGRRKRLHLQRIHNRQGVWFEEEKAIAVESIDFYQKQFTQERDANFPLLRHIPTLINAEEKSVLCRMPELEEVKNVVFKLNGDGASGLDGLTGIVYQSC
ncbi:uncharacterized protein [Solanum tuberosum]|uniref:uncharacterized protein n=1 Tax=Solanum tuberosum TaxID=4113 RepID=UPI00073A0CF5|nr:PREDICTED: uncharacterized protein LOC107062902 [Solanum tuberosum]